MGLFKDIFLPENPGPFHFVRLRVIATVTIVAVFGSYYLITEYLKDRASKERFRISEVERVNHMKQLIQNPSTADYFYLKMDNKTRFLNTIKDERDSILCKISAEDASIPNYFQIKKVVDYFNKEVNAPQRKFAKTDLLKAICFDESDANFSSCHSIKGLNNDNPLHINKAYRYYGINMYTRTSSSSKTKNHYWLGVINEGLDVDVIGFNYPEGIIRPKTGNWPINVKKKDFLNFYVEPTEPINMDKELKFELIANTALKDSIRIVFNRKPKEHGYRITNF